MNSLFIQLDLLVQYQEAAGALRYNINEQDFKVQHGPSELISLIQPLSSTSVKHRGNLMLPRMLLSSLKLFANKSKIHINYDV